MGEFYEKQKNKYSSDSSRYKGCSVLVDKETGDALLETRSINKIPRNNKDTYHTMSSHEVGRLDKLAYDYYKNPELWWVIAQANNIKDPFTETHAGLILRIPCMETLYAPKKGVLGR